MKRLRFRAFVIEAIGVIDFEIQPVGREYREKQVVGVEAEAAEHRFGAESLDRRQLIEHEPAESFAHPQRSKRAAASAFA